MKKVALSPELKATLKRLKLGAMADTLPDRIALAEKERVPIQDFLLLLEMVETAFYQVNVAKFFS